MEDCPRFDVSIIICVNDVTKEKAMKKQMLIVILISLSILILGGCGTSENELMKDSETENVVKAADTEQSDNEQEVQGETRKDTEEVENIETYTYTNLTTTLYASTEVNVRNLPSAEGEIIGGLKINEEVSITGKCNETGWYRIAYNGNTGFVSDLYMIENKAEMEEEKTE